MSLCDTIRCIDAQEALRLWGFACAAGHALMNFQSKDFGERQEGFLLGRGFLWVLRGRAWQDREVAMNYMVENRTDGSFLLESCTSEYRVDTGRSGDFMCYAECKDCPPAFVLSLGLGSGLSLYEHWPVSRFRLTLLGGALHRVEPLERETRETIEREFAARGQRVLAESDPIVVAYRARAKTREA